MYEALIGPRMFRRDSLFVVDFASDPDLLRRALLFYEHVHLYRGSGIQRALTKDEQFLVDKGVASPVDGKTGFSENGFFRISTGSTEMLLGDDSSGGIFDAFRKDGAEIIRQGGGSIHPLLIREPLQSEVGQSHISVELVKGVTLPSRDIPLDELIGFRQEHAEGLRRYWTFVDDLAAKLGAHRPSKVAIRQALGVLADSLEENHNVLRRHFKSRLVAASASIVLLPVSVGGAMLALDAFPALGDFTLPLSLWAGAAELALANVPFAGPPNSNPAVGYVQEIQRL